MLYYGKYRAFVTDTDDSEERGRIRVVCPKVLGQSKSPWCEPCIPFAYDGGGDFYLPKTGDTVWIEFEEGNPNYPIWVGGWWSEQKTPISDYSSAAKQRVLEFAGVKFNMKEGSLVIEVGDSKLTMTNNSVIISSPSITHSGNTTVGGNINAAGNISTPGDVLAGNISLKTHTHSYSWSDSGGSGNTSAPQ